MISFDSMLKLRVGGDYQRDDFDNFIKKTKFVYKTPSIHIAGTNGKGSTANYIASIYRKTGLKVGLFTSPALVNVNESITINGVEISDEEIIAYIKDNKKEYEKFDLSSFEVLTHMALSYFDKNNCDVAIIECGMGGAIDATNIFTPILSIITSVSLEHTNFLGRSISEIALNKAGIIKDDIPVLVGNVDEDAMEVISGIAKDRGSKLVSLSLPARVTYHDGYDFDYLTYLNMHINSIALYSVDDACFALDAVTILNDRFPVTIEQVKAGIAEVVMPARLEIVCKKPLVIVDGAHNPEAMEKLAKALANPCGNSLIHTVFACFRDKNLNSLLASIGEVSEDITLTTFDHPRARTIDDYFLFIEDHKFVEDCIEAIKTNMTEHPNDITLVTGSLAFAGYVRNLFKIGAIKGE